jgi:hypothetical protein
MQLARISRRYPPALSSVSARKAELPERHQWRYRVEVSRIFIASLLQVRQPLARDQQTDRPPLPCNPLDQAVGF